MIPMKRQALFPALLLLAAASGTAGGQLAYTNEEDTLQQEAGALETARLQGRPLADFLNPDGTLTLPPDGIEGSIDPSGFRLASLPGEPPCFEATDSSTGLSVPSDENWDPRFTLPGVNGAIRALAWDGANLYAGGDFTIAGGAIIHGIARWDGNQWNALGSGIDGSVYALAWDGTNLYVGGEFVTAGGIWANSIAKWDGNAWSALGAGTAADSGYVGKVLALTWHGTNLCVGGDFWSAGEVIANGIAMWDGTVWSSFGSGIGLKPNGANGYACALVSDGTNLYVGGDFTKVGGVAASGFAKWDGSSWSAISAGVSNVRALARDGSNLYAAGNGGIAKWDGSAWSAIASGWGDSVYALAWDGTNLYAAGNYGVAQWDGSAWSAVGTGITGSVNALSIGGAVIYAGGLFGSSGGAAACNIANWNGISWISMPDTGSGMSNGVWGTVGVNALAWDGTNLYAGGNFTSAGGVAVNYIARWDGSAWSPLGAGVNSVVNALVWSGGYLFAGGRFTLAGGVPANRIARWDGSAWSALGSGMNEWVNALAWDGTNLYAGGRFSSAGGTSALYIAKWNGSAWSALGSGMSSTVQALTWNGTDLYAGGNFTTAGGISANRIARWDGSSWSALGSGMDGLGGVYALAWDGRFLYAGGNFTTVGGLPASRIARWDGNAWSALGSGINSIYWQVGVDVLAWDDGFLYVGGAFTTADGVATNYIAKWNGIEWSALGSGMNDQVRALACDGTSIYAGGSFTTAGEKVSSYIGRWAIPPCSAPSTASPISAVDADMCAYTGVSLTWPADATDWGDAGAGTRTYDVLRDGATIGPELTYGITQYTDDGGLNGSTYAYAVRYVNGCGLHATTATSEAADLSNAPGTPAITGISDVNACVQNGIGVYYSPGTGASRHDLYSDGSLVVEGYASGAIYNPSDTGSHAYVVRAMNADCVKDSLEQPFSDHTAPSPTIAGPTPACSPGLLSTQAYATYQWYRNGFIIHGAAHQSYDSIVPGTYTVLVTDAFACQATSSGFVINSSPSTPGITGEGTGCSSTGVELSTGANASYQWSRDGVDIPTATAQTLLATQSGTYRVRVANAAGCTATSAGHSLAIANNPQPAIAGDHVNSCPAVSVALSTGAYAGYQWYFNGAPISGAIAPTYHAGVTGNYSVHVVDPYGCLGVSTAYLVFIDFCPATEVSPASAIFPLRVIKNAASGTGYYIFFQRVDSTDGYNIYEGVLASPWDFQYHHADQPGNGCGVAATDLGTGEMRSALVPSDGNRYYLVTAFGGGAEGPSGFDSMGLEIPASQSTCTP